MLGCMFVTAHTGALLILLLVLTGTSVGGTVLGCMFASADTGPLLVLVLEQ